MIKVKHEEGFELVVGMRRIALTRAEAEAAAAQLTIALAAHPQRTSDKVVVRYDAAGHVRSAQYSPRENGMLRALYSDPKWSVREIARKMRRTEHSIYVQANRLGLSRPINVPLAIPNPPIPEPVALPEPDPEPEMPDDPDWTREQQAYLERAMAAGKTTRYVALYLKVPLAIVNAKWTATLERHSG